MARMNHQSQARARLVERRRARIDKKSDLLRSDLHMTHQRQRTASSRRCAESTDRRDTGPCRTKFLNHPRQPDTHSFHLEVPDLLLACGRLHSKPIEPFVSLCTVEVGILDTLKN